MHNIYPEPLLGGLKTEEARRALPRFLYNRTIIKAGYFKIFCLKKVQILLQAYIYVMLRPRRGKVGTLDGNEVDVVYRREAETYDRKHHLTTSLTDTSWRRAAGWALVALARELGKNPQVLDLCTGTGLTIKEMGNILKENGLDACFIGLDYTEAMLEMARKQSYRNEFKVSFVQGDATKLTFEENSFDFVSQVFGIGGIPLTREDSAQVFVETLKVLNIGGRFYLHDMHRPIPSQPGEYPLLVFGGVPMPLLEIYTYLKSTVPLVLNRLWGWRDPTINYYLAEFTTYRAEKTGKYWGFRVLSEGFKAESWWFDFPVMPTKWTLSEKVEISKEECQRRNSIREDILQCIESQ
ncbi:MAG: methyltransferase domain-containing protein [Patescibacteria group bacterium]